MNRRAPMIAGIAFAVLYAAAVLVIPALPDADDGAARVRALLLAFSAFALAVVLAFARDRLSGPAAHLFTVGSALLLAQLCVAIWFTGGPALRPGQLDTAAARVIGDVGSMWLPAATVANILVAVPILLAANEDRFPRWLGIGTAVFTVEQLLETITVIGPPGSFIAPGGPMNHYLGGTLTVAFFLAVGICLSLPESAPDDTATVAEPAPVEQPTPADDPAGE
ncbi:hypothetical protein [Mycolicibacterium pyrenivorans]|uniref:hypothetical protein n=1 Tax=Mycolicibacterium pyrenivorans TaxID=187102 RepID=UPI0021F34E65|nr:hypothetical protein [Mycolicibacterium pyrenivorans]MCV7154484.1 hypothetical protein [Mycolicibacterium pyrenivorans]